MHNCKKKFCQLTFFLVVCFNAHAQKDSLLNAFKSTKSLHDSVRGNMCLALGDLYYNNEGNLDSSFFYFEKAKTYFSAKKNKAKLSQAWSGIGLIYREKGIYNKALEAYLKANTFATEAKNKNRIAKSLNGIAVVHAIQNNLDKALDNYTQALNLYVSMGDKKGQASVLNNIGLLYVEKKSPDEALVQYNNALKLNKENNDLRGIATNTENIGLVYLNDLNDAQKAMQAFSTSIGLWRSLGDEFSTSITLQYVANALYKTKQYQACVDSANLSLTLAKKNNSLSVQMDAHSLLWQAYEKIKQPDKALFHYKEFSRLKDEISNEEKIKEIAEIQFRYDFNKQKNIDSLKAEAKHQLEIEKKQLALNQQKKFTFWLSAGLLLTLLLVVFIWLISRKNKKAKEEIALQKILIEVKNREVMDSIKYASRIQQAILPPDEQMKKLLRDYFIYYLPKDIVSGDFYWIEEKDDLVFLAVVDCTGHGVPGAFMSIVGRNALNDAVNIENLVSSEKILDYVNTYVCDTLHYQYDSHKVPDGMDMALIVWNKKTNSIDFSGANNPLWIVRHNSTLVEEYRGTKQPIGNYTDRKLSPFKNTKIALNKGDTVYLLTDGYADQFGGPRGKKLKYIKLQQTLLQYNHLGLEKVHNGLGLAFEEWKGSLEQVDDVCILGLKI